MPNAHAVIAIVSNDKSDLHSFEVAASEVDLQVTCRMCSSVEQLLARHEHERVDIVAFWHARAPITDNALRACLSELADGPQLLLVADSVTAQDHVQAHLLNADDVISTTETVHFSLAVRRALRTVELRRQLTAARRELEQNKVMEQTTPAGAEGWGDIPPLVHTIDRALRTDGLHLVFQPVVSVHDSPHEIYEAFVRLRHEDGDIMPGDFLPVATRYGLLPAVDRWVVRNAVKRYVNETRRKNQTGSQLHFVLNVSAHTLVEERATEFVLKTIATARPKPGSFIIKLDKNTIFSRLAFAKSLNRMAKELGLQFAIDQYEESDTRLNYLEHVSVDYIKLHGSLIAGIDRDRAKLRQVEQILATARQHDISVIAGQIERAEELAALYQLGVDYVQGYLIGDPRDELDYDRGETSQLG